MMGLDFGKVGGETKGICLKAGDHSDRSRREQRKLE